LIRINKYLSLCGVTSRRGAEQLISEKRVTVNDVTIDRLGTVIDEKNDIVRVDGTIADLARKKFYILLNKPKMVLTTLHDPFKRKTVQYYVKTLAARVYPVGRLDYDTEGALILTNDGELAYRLAHPKYEVKKVYRALVVGAFTADHATEVANGIKLDDGHIGRAEVEILDNMVRRSVLRLTLTEGHKREIKQLMKAVGHPVIDLRRVEIAGLRVDDLKPGRWRHLNHIEIRTLKDMVGIK
jgi:23S rRNA pseudouridine2605 synthase